MAEENKKSIKERIEEKIVTIKSNFLKLANHQSTLDVMASRLESLYEKRKEELLKIQQNSSNKAKEELTINTEDVTDNKVNDETNEESIVEEDDVKPESKLINDITEDDFKKPEEVVQDNKKPSEDNNQKPNNQFNNDKKFKKDYGNKNFDEDGQNKNNKKNEKGNKHNKQNLSIDLNNIVFDEDGDIIENRRTTRVIRKDKPTQQKPIVKTQIDHFVMTTKTIPIKTFSEKIGKSVSEIIKKLFIDYDMQLTINDSLDTDLAILIGDAFNVKVELNIEATKEEKLESLHDDAANDSPELLKERPPVVTIMGHVDHGKTSILDYIRNSHLTDKEAGGITQYIGAYTINVPFEGENKQITFLDTPGHEAFTAMRARGANITDIIVLVVAADDGIMPQTIEAISHAKAAKVPIIVAINKMDKVGADPQRVLQQLSEYGILSEEWGGDIPTIRVSAKTGEGISDLIENMLTIAQISDLKANPSRKAKGTVIESQLDKGRGPVATILVQNGTLKIGDYVVIGTCTGRIRSMIDDKGKNVKKATPSMPVSITGLKSLPESGDQMLVVDNEKLAKQVVDERIVRENLEREQIISKRRMFDMVNSEASDRKILNLIIKADVKGTCEAVKESLLKLSTDEVEVKVVHSQVGAVIESDIDLADTTNSTIIGFNVRIEPKIKTLAEHKGIKIMNYEIIYKAIEDIEKSIKGLLEPQYEEVVLGTAEVKQVFKITGVGTIAGSLVKSGTITRNDKARLYREGVKIFDTYISSLRIGKEDKKEVAQGFECGIGINNYTDLKAGDIIEVYTLKETN